MAEKKAKQINTPMQDAFLSALSETKGDVRAAMRKAGYSDNTTMKEVVAPLRDQIMAVAEETMAMNAMKAVGGLIDTIDKPDAVGAKVRVAAIKELLDRVGLIRKEPIQNALPPGAIIVMPPKNVEQDD